jgi:hypothetical protein
VLRSSRVRAQGHELDYDQNKAEPYRSWSIQYASLRPLPTAVGDRQYSGAAGAKSAALPALPQSDVHPYLGLMQMTRIISLGPERTFTAFECYALDEPDEWSTDVHWSKLVGFGDAGPLLGMRADSTEEQKLVRIGEARSR